MARFASPSDPARERLDLRSAVSTIAGYTIGACCAVVGAGLVVLAGIGVVDLVRLVLFG
jgi:uncharacterized membrane protein